MRCLVLAVLLSIRLAPSTSAQTAPSRVFARMSGIVLDSASGRPPDRSTICASFAAAVVRCARIDSAGAYRLDSLPLSSVDISVNCETMHSLGTGVVAARIAFSDSTPLHRDWRLTIRGCDPRPLRRITGVFRGQYTGGFETSAFVACRADSWLVPSDSIDSARPGTASAWADWPAHIASRMNWDVLKPDSFGTSRLYVRWRGTIVGPGRYGHMGSEPFELRVDSVLEFRAPRPQDCR